MYVVVADPTSKTAVQNHDSTAIQGVVCNVAEARKRNYYREVMRVKPEGVLVPLALEPTGMEVRQGSIGLLEPRGGGA